MSSSPPPPSSSVRQRRVSGDNNDGEKNNDKNNNKKKNSDNKSDHKSHNNASATASPPPPSPVKVSFVVIFGLTLALSTLVVGLSLYMGTRTVFRTGVVSGRSMQMPGSSRSEAELRKAAAGAPGGASSAAASAASATTTTKRDDERLSDDEIRERQRRFVEKERRRASADGDGDGDDPRRAAARLEWKLFTADELRRYDGRDADAPLLLSIMGRVFDVTKGEKHYARGGGYNFFTGRDGTRAFVTGEFNDAGLRDDVSDLDGSQLQSIVDWTTFYVKDYTEVGRFAGGFFYDSDGAPREAHHSVIIEKLEEHRRARDASHADNVEWPACNSRWSKDDGSTFWCTARSGGVERAWVGVPRKKIAAGETTTRCVCVDEARLAHPELREYAGCDPSATECKLGRK